MIEKKVINELIALDDVKYHLKKYIEEYGAGKEIIKTIELLKTLLIRYGFDYNTYLETLVKNRGVDSPILLNRAINRELKLKSKLEYNINRQLLGRKKK